MLKWSRLIAGTGNQVKLTRMYGQRFSDRYSDRTVNAVQLLGRVGKDPQVVYVMEDTGTKCVAFPVVTLNPMKQRNEGEDTSSSFRFRESWLPVRPRFPSLHGFALNNLKAGYKVFIKGSLRTIRENSTVEDEPPRFNTIVSATDIIVLDHGNTSELENTENYEDGPMIGE